jgi:hypothetical protein
VSDRVRMETANVLSTRFHLFPGTDRGTLDKAGSTRFVLVNREIEREKNIGGSRCAVG